MDITDICEILEKINNNLERIANKLPNPQTELQILQEKRALQTLIYNYAKDDTPELRDIIQLEEKTDETIKQELWKEVMKPN
jgi:hypothetical protein